MANNQFTRAGSLKSVRREIDLKIVDVQKIEFPSQMFNVHVQLFEDKFIAAGRSDDFEIRLFFLDQNLRLIPDSFVNPMFQATDPKVVKIGSDWRLVYSTYAGYLGQRNLDGLWHERMRTAKIHIQDGKITVDPKTDEHLTIVGCPGYRRKREKAWSPFEFDGEMYYVHRRHPHVVLFYDEKTGNAKYNPEWVHPWDASDWDCEIRGDAAPIRLGDAYLTFFHIRTPRSYRIGYYLFEARPPFGIIQIHKGTFIDAEQFLNNRSAGGLGQFLKTHEKCVFPTGGYLTESGVSLFVGAQDWATFKIDMTY